MDLKHKPFSALRGVTIPTNKSAPKEITPAILQPLGRIIVREEIDAKEGAITRLIGLPANQLDTLGKQLRRALSLTVLIEGRDLLIQGEEHDLIANWLTSKGANIVRIRRPSPPKLSHLGIPGGTIRAEIRRGSRVAIVLKADQPSGTLTEGIVQDILTSAPRHPRGIKVRLESGQIGRVQRFLKELDGKDSSR